MLPEEAWVAADSTAFTSNHASEYFEFRRARDGKKISIRNWPKLGFVVEPRSHLILGITLGQGLSYDFRLWEPLLTQAVRHVKITLAMADAGFDSEANHVIARQQLGVRRTLINLNRRGNGRRIHGRYRREMSRGFDHRAYGQRWQAETAASQMKRRFGAVLSARTEATQQSELELKVLTHNIAIVP